MNPDDAAQHYAEALTGLVPDTHALEQVASAVRFLAERAVADRSARLYWRSLSVTRETKRRLLGELVDAARAPDIVRPFVEVLLENNRVADLPEIADALDAAVAERLGRTVAHVTSARPLAQAEQEAIRRHLAKVSGKDVELVTDVDEGLLGGVRVRLENRVIDDSVRGRLAAFLAQFE